MAREHNKGTNRASTGVVRIRRIPAGLLPPWQERENVDRVSTGMTWYQPGFYRCGKREQREQQINRASTGVMTEFLRRRLQPGFYRCGPGLRGNLGRFSGHRFSTRLAEIINLNKRRYTNRLVNRVSTDVTAKMRGFRSRLWLVTVYRPAGGAPNVNRGCPERGANRASTGVATIVQGSSSLARAGTGSQPAGSIPRMNRRTPRPSCTNRASTYVANDVRKCDQPDFCRCGRGAVLANLCQGGRDDQE
jgi:hypothetical protein